MVFRVTCESSLLCMVGNAYVAPLFALLPTIILLLATTSSCAHGDEPFLNAFDSQTVATDAEDLFASYCLRLQSVDSANEGESSEGNGAQAGGQGSSGNPELASQGQVDSSVDSVGFTVNEICAEQSCETCTDFDAPLVRHRNGFIQVLR